MRLEHLNVTGDTLYTQEGQFVYNKKKAKMLPVKVFGHILSARRKE